MIFSNHGIVAAVELAVFMLLLAPAIHNVIHFGIRQHKGWLLITLFCLFKITGAALLIYTVEERTKASISLQVTMQIFYQIALGPLLSATLAFFNGEPPTKTTSPSTRVGRNLPAHLPRFLKLVHILVIVALVLAINGGIGRAPQSNGQINNSKYDGGATYLKISSILFFVALVGISYGLIRYWSTRSVMSEPQRTIIPAIAAAIPLLLMRVIYSLLASFTLNTSGNMGHTMAFNLFSGNIAAYIVLAMIPQISVVVLYSVTGVIAKRRHQEAKVVDGSSGKIPIELF